MTIQDPIFKPETKFERVTRTRWGWWWMLIKRAVFYLGSILLLGWSAQTGRYLLTAGLAMVVSALGLAMHRRLADKEALEGSLAVKLLVWSLVFETGLVIAATQQWRILGFVGFLGLTMMAFGLGQLAAEVRAEERICGTVALLFVINLVVALVVSIGFGMGGSLLLLVAIVMAYPAIGFGTEFVLDHLQTRWNGDLRKLMVLGAAGSVVAALGVFLLRDVGGWRFAILVAVIVVVVVGMVASNTDADMLFVLFAFAVVWSQAPRGDRDPPPFVDGKDNHSIVVLGDSYISGEGARDYLNGTNTKDAGSYDQCRRSERAWAIRVAEDKDLQLDFVACSGAKATHITEEGQYVGENPGDKYVTSPDGDNPQHKLSQIELYKVLRDNREASRANKDDAATLDWVFVSIGGNDAGFGDLVADCLSPGDCSLGGQRWLNQLHDKLEPTLASLYDSLANPDRLKALGVEEFAGKVVVVPYPIPIAETECAIFNSLFTNREHKFLNSFTDQMDTIIERQAALHGLRFVSDMRGIFKANDVRICDTEAASAAVNYIGLNPVGGDVDPTGWVHNSMHPNETGHELMAGVIDSWLDAKPAPEDPSTVAEPSLSLTEIMNDGRTYCSADEPEVNCVPAQKVPASERLPRVARHGVEALVVLALGSWMVWLAVLSRRRKARTETPGDRWVFSRYIDHLSKGRRWAVAVGLLVLAAIFMTVEAWVGGLSGGYGNSQSDTATELREKTLAVQSSLHAATWRDMVIYIPVYVVFGILIILSVRPHYRKLSVSRLLDVLHVRGVPRVSLWAMIALVLAGLADLVETALFRESLRRLREFHASADIDTLTVVTRWMTFAKLAFGAIACVLLVQSVVSRGVKAILSRSEIRKIVKNAAPNTDPMKEPGSLSGRTFAGSMVSAFGLANTFQDGPLVALGDPADPKIGAGHIQSKDDVDPAENLLVFYVAVPTAASPQTSVVVHALDAKLDRGESLSFPRRVGFVNGVNNTFIVAVVSPPADDDAETWAAAKAWRFNDNGLVELPADRVKLVPLPPPPPPPPKA